MILFDDWRIQTESTYGVLLTEQEAFLAQLAWSAGMLEGWSETMDQTVRDFIISKLDRKFSTAEPKPASIPMSAPMRALYIEALLAHGDRTEEQEAALREHPRFGGIPIVEGEDVI